VVVDGGRPPWDCQLCPAWSKAAHPHPAPTHRARTARALPQRPPSPTIGNNRSGTTPQDLTTGQGSSSDVRMNGQAGREQRTKRPQRMLSRRRFHSARWRVLVGHAGCAIQTPNRLTEPGWELPDASPVGWEARVGERPIDATITGRPSVRLAHDPGGRDASSVLSCVGARRAGTSSHVKVMCSSAVGGAAQWTDRVAQPDRRR
jgi:hypothetical protein